MIFLGEVNYTHAGEYTVAENKMLVESYSKKWSTLLILLIYDNRNYEMHVIVKNKTPGGTYISSVYFKQVSPSVNGKVNH